jgi:hypothetical protein
MTCIVVLQYHDRSVHRSMAAHLDGLVAWPLAFHIGPGTTCNNPTSSSHPGVSKANGQWLMANI